jgi:hypothetical protein
MVQIWRSGEARDPGGGGWSGLLNWWSGMAGRSTIIVLITLLFFAAYLLFWDRS